MKNGSEVGSSVVSVYQGDISFKPSKLLEFKFSRDNDRRKYSFYELLYFRNGKRVNEPSHILDEQFGLDYIPASPILAKNINIKNQEEHKNLKVVSAPQQIQDLYSFVEELSLEPKLENAINSSIVTPFHIKNGFPQGILNHLFYLKNKYRYTYCLNSNEEKLRSYQNIIDNRKGYIRLQIIKPNGTAPGSNAVMEIWPPFCCSTIHDHGDAFGLVKVLSGSIYVENFHYLCPKGEKPTPYIRNLYEKGGYTWMS